jgi:hypothetical protein
MTEDIFKVEGTVELATGMRECPSCGLLSPQGALLCTHCGYNFVAGASYGSGSSSGGRGTGFGSAGGSGGSDGAINVARRNELSAVDWLRALAWINFGITALAALFVWLFSAGNAGTIGATILAALVLVEGAVVTAFLMVIAGMADTVSGIGEDMGMLTSLLRKR